jgi:rRNA-processing protein FCF1
MIFIVDANVLIDYAKTDRSILSLVALHIGPVHVPSCILREVDQLTPQDCHDLGLIIVQETQAQWDAVSPMGGALSSEDRMCLLMAVSNGWICVTNDRALRNACAKAQVKTLGGLGLLIQLAQHGHLTAPACMAVARAIHRTNPFMISTAVIQQLKADLEKLGLFQGHTP